MIWNITKLIGNVIRLICMLGLLIAVGTVLIIAIAVTYVGAINQYGFGLTALGTALTLAGFYGLSQFIVWFDHWGNT